MSNNNNPFEPKNYLSDGHFPEPKDTVLFDRMWRNIANRRAQDKPQVRQVWRLAPAFVVVLLLVMAAWFHGRYSSQNEASPEVHLALDSTELSALLADETRELIEFTDGSRLRRSDKAHIGLIKNTSQEIMFRFEKGTVDFDIQPNRNRKWSIDCGVATVVVLGTQFKLVRTQKSLDIRVQRGVVAVQSSKLPDVTRRLVRGESLSISIPEGIVDPQTPEIETPNQLESSLPPTEPPTEPTEPPTSESPIVEAQRGIHERQLKRSKKATSLPDWRQAALKREYDKAFSLLKQNEFRQSVQKARSVEELLLLADVARYSGHSRKAVLPLTLVVQNHSHDPRAALSAFTLGRLYRYSFNNPYQAVQWFSKTIELATPGAIMEDAYMSLVEVKNRSGDRAGARSSATRYLNRFPQGRHASRMKTVVQNNEAHE